MAHRNLGALLVPGRFTLYLLGHFVCFKSHAFKIKIDIFSPLIVPEENKCLNSEKYVHTVKRTQIPVCCVNVKQESCTGLFVLGQHDNHQPFLSR